MASDDLSFPPSSRHSAFQQLEAFLSSVESYADRRNYLEPGHGNVSRLSPAIRTRLVLETEIIKAVRKRFPAHRVEKFEQEVWWRLYWKGWLEMRPAVWSEYREDLRGLGWSDRALEVASGKSGVAIMDHFAGELIETGYLHNHTRMWWAAFWVHVEKLPWQLGADFFLRNLCDGDAASNTLSWRWVAGLHTKGKSYLVRRSNLEAFVDREILDANPEGLERLEGVSPLPVVPVEPPVPVPLPGEGLPQWKGRFGCWIHDEDLLLESSPLSGLHPSAVAAFSPTGLWEREFYSKEKRIFLSKALEDGAGRASGHFGILSAFLTVDVLSEAIAEWAVEKKLTAVVAMRPFVGPLADELPAIETRLRKSGIELILVRRPDDVTIMNKATAGFFGFWKKTKEDRAFLT